MKIPVKSIDPSIGQRSVIVLAHPVPYDLRSLQRCLLLPVVLQCRLQFSQLFLEPFHGEVVDGQLVWLQLSARVLY